MFTTTTTLSNGETKTGTRGRGRDAIRAARELLKKDSGAVIVITDPQGMVVFEANVEAAEVVEDAPAAEVVEEVVVEEVVEEVAPVVPVVEVAVVDEEPVVELAGEVVDVTAPVPADQIPAQPKAKRGARFVITDTNLMAVKPGPVSVVIDGESITAETTPAAADARILQVEVGGDVKGAILRGPGGYWRTVTYAGDIAASEVVEISAKCNSRTVAVATVLAAKA
jgi:hypothetical protein